MNGVEQQPDPETNITVKDSDPSVIMAWILLMSQSPKTTKVIAEGLAELRGI